MSDSHTLSGERVFCHQCSHEWNRVEGGLLCPNCDSEFAEVIEAPPLRPPETRPPPPIPQQHGFHYHLPWAEGDVPDPEEDDITTYQWNSRGGNGTLSFTSRTFVSGGGRNRQDWRNVEDPIMQDLVQNFEGLLTQISGTQNLMNGPPPPRTGLDNFPFNALGPFGLPQRQAQGSPRASNRNAFAADQDGILRPQGGGQGHDQGFFNPQELFSMIFGALNGPPRAAQGQAHNHPPELAALLSQLLGPRTGRDGDAVFTQEAFDQVITQLMDQNQGSTAPPPATAQAIAALPKKKVAADMLADDGKAECSICMDEVAIGTEVSILPCDHWFHHGCIEHWLKQHDTCPHCRKPIQDHSEQPASPSSNRHRTSTGRRPSSVASPRASQADGSAQNPYTLPDSPSGIRERRNQYFHDWNAPDGEDVDRSQNRRSTSAQSRSRPSGGRSGSQNSNQGGAIGWMRNHNPFGG